MCTRTAIVSKVALAVVYVDIARNVVTAIDISMDKDILVGE